MIPQPQNFYGESRKCCQFLKFCFLLATLTKFQGEKAFLSGNLICYISETEGRRTLKLGEVGLACQNFSRKNRAKKFPT